MHSCNSYSGGTHFDDNARPIGDIRFGNARPIGDIRFGADSCSATDIHPAGDTCLGNDTRPIGDACARLFPIGSAFRGATRPRLARLLRALLFFAFALALPATAAPQELLTATANFSLGDTPPLAPEPAPTAPPPPLEPAPETAPPPPDSAASIDTPPLALELALTAPERQLGLMHRPALPSNAGMLFVFEQPRPLSFWMKDTSLELSIAFLDRAGAIINIEPLEPFSLASVPSLGEAQYALEVHRSYFQERDIAVGAEITLADCPTRVALLRRAPQKVVSAVLRLCR